MKIRSVGTELFAADRRTDMAELIVAILRTRLNTPHMIVDNVRTDQ